MGEQAEFEYRVAVAKRDERVGGVEGAASTMTCPIDVVRSDDFDAAVEFMRGRLKAVGAADDVFEVLRSGAATAALTAIAATID